MKNFLRNLTVCIVLALVAFVALGSWAVHEKASRDAKPLRTERAPAPDASQARAVCREFIERQTRNAEPLFFQLWRVKAPADGGNRWQVVAEYKLAHTGGVLTVHRSLCVIELQPGAGWRLVKLV